MPLYYHPESDSLFRGEPEDTDIGGGLCEDVTGDPEFERRARANGFGVPEHVFITPEYCKCDPDTHCYTCDGGLSFCVICRCAESELTTECPGAPPSEEQREEIAHGRLNFWSGVWFDEAA